MHQSSVATKFEYETELNNKPDTDTIRVAFPHKTFEAIESQADDSEILYDDSLSLLSQRTSMFLMITSVIFLLVQLVQFEDPVGLDLVELLDMSICVILLADFVYDFYKTPNKLFFLRHRWWEPLSSIPLIDTGHKAVLAIRLLRIIRIMRIIKLHKDIRIYLRKGNAFLVKNKVLDISSIVLVTILGGSLGFFYAEQGVNPNLKTYSDSIWWALVTVTTIGYGDIFPVTTMGRFVATTMMVIGIGCVSTLTGMIAANVMRDNKCPNCGGDI